MKQKLIPYLLILLSIVAGAMRVAGSNGEAYQALTHVFVGGLFGAALCKRRLPLILAVVLTALEVACFLTRGHSS